MRCLKGLAVVSLAAILGACAAAQASELLASDSHAEECPPGYGEGQIPEWRQAFNIIESGDSIGCKLC